MTKVGRDLAFGAGAVVCAFVQSPVQAGQPGAPSAAPLERASHDWPEIVRRDARAVYENYRDSHPGAVDPENPEFRRKLDEGLQRAFVRAARAKSYGDYWWALREYSASFDDGHAEVSQGEAVPDTVVTWPGFLTRYDSGRYVVAGRLQEDGLPPNGAVLTSCGGIDADQLAERNVGRFFGRWWLASQRDQLGWLVFFNDANAMALRPERCEFRQGGSSQSYALRWRVIPPKEIGPLLRTVRNNPRAPISARRLDDGGYWVSLGSFNGNPESGAYKELEAVLRTLSEQREELRRSPRVVFDLRGNNGGSSVWSVRLAELLWGEDYVRAKRPRGSAGVDWRVSDANIATVEEQNARLLGTANPDPEGVRTLTSILRGLKRARGEGRELWRQTTRAGGSQAPQPVKTSYAGKVFLITNTNCASACLDAVDLWKELGAVHVGRETSADSLYMEVRDQPLPSGLSRLLVPMKVYRGRRRGSNVPHRPLHEFPGDMSDTAGLEAWIQLLDRKGG